MYKNLSVPMLTVVVLSGCTTVDLKPVVKPSNPRVIERALVADRASAPRMQPVVKPMVPLTEDITPHAAAPAPGSKAEAEPTKPSQSSQKAPGAANAVKPPVSHKTDINATRAPVEAVLPADKANSEKKVAPDFWEVKPTDIRLSATFERWARESGERGKPVTVLWHAGRHVLIEAPTRYAGSFQDAVENALKSPSILHSDYPLEACVYPNSPPVVRVTRLGEQKRECPQYR